MRRFLDVGFSFERWYGTNGHVFDRDIPPFDSICRRYVNNGGKLDENDAEILRVAQGNHHKRRKRRGKNARTESGTETMEETAIEEVDTADSAAIGVEAVVVANEETSVKVGKESTYGANVEHDLNNLNEQDGVETMALLQIPSRT